jgi:hypothetical protein
MKLTISKTQRSEKSSVKLQHKILYTVFVSLLFKVVLDVLFAHVIADMYGYVGFELQMSHVKLAESYLLVAVVAALLTTSDTKPSSVSLQLIYALFVIPFLVMYSMQDSSRIFTYFIVSSFLLTVFMTKFSVPFVIKPIRGGKEIVLFLGATITTAVLLIILIVNGVPSWRSFDMNAVYAIRSEFQTGKLFEVAQGLVTYVIVPFAFADSYIKRRYSILGLLLLYTCIIAGLSGGKYMLFVLFLTFFIAVLVQKKMNIIAGFAWLNIGLMIVSLAIYLYSNNLMFFHLSVTRPIFIPAWLTFEYYKFFLVHPLLFFSETFPIFVQSPYDLPSALIIGESLFGSEGSSWANGGMFAAGYANLHFIGMLLFAFLYGAILLIADNIYRCSGQPAFLIVMAVVSNHLIHASLLTVLNSRGLLFLLILGWLAMKRRGDDQFVEKQNA